MKRTSAFVALGLALQLALAPVTVATDLGDRLVHLRVETWDAAAGPGVPPDEARLAPGAWVVVLEGPQGSGTADALEAAGGRVLGYVPSNAWLVWGDAEDARRMGQAAGVLRVEPYRAAWKISPEIAPPGARAEAAARYFVEIWPGESPAAAADRVRAAGAEVLQVVDGFGLRRLVVRADRAALPRIAAIPAVQWIEDLPRPTLRNDTVRWVIQSDNAATMAVPLYDRGLLGDGEIIGHIDEPPYLPSCYFRDDTDNTPGPLHRKVVALRRVNPPSTGAHGTHTAGTAAGENVDPGFPQHRGMAPKARLSCSSYYDLHGATGDTVASNLAEFFALAHADGARIHTNSWGDDTRFDYTAWCVDIDTFSRQHEDDLVVFSATNLATLRTPENAKNCLAVGATLRPPSQGVRSSGGTGPTADGRRKPEVYAPGRDTRSALVGECATGASTGTSMAAPAVAGGAALVREYFRRGFHPTGSPWPAHERIPTGALLKAVVINSAVDMTGEVGYPSNVEGWGRILLDDALYFPGDARRLWLRDVRHAQGLGTGQQDVWRFEVASSAQPLKVTLVFVDQPAAPGAGLTPVNDLDLEVQGPGGLYRGNVIDTLTGQSLTGGSPDALNDVERVLLAAPPPGEYTVRVRGASVPLGPQGYAVVANGALSPRDFVTAPAPDDDHAGAAPAARAAVTAPLVLDRPVPNPFRTSTTVRFALPEAGPVDVAVYDLAGRRVRALVAASLDAGEQRITWDGRDDAGARVSAGIYFVRLSAAGGERLVKTALLR